MRQIARHLDVSLSSASVWTRGAAPAASAPSAASEPPLRRVELLRWCSRCGRFRPESTFNRHPAGLQWWCRDCFKAYMRSAEHRASHDRIPPELRSVIALERLEHLHTYDVVAE